MLQVPRLDGDDYESIFQRARARIPALTSEWTNFNAADPGITTLQTFAWLFDTLHYYMNAAGEVHRLKYLKLLGIRPEQRPAECVLAFEGEGVLDVPAGTRVWAGDIPFETAEPLGVRANRMTSAWLHRGGKAADLTHRAGVDGGFAPLFAPGGAPGEWLALGFEHPLDARTRLYLEIAAEPRTPFDGSFALAQLAWEFFDGDAWREARVVSDETCGLLRSGFVALELDRPHAAGEPDGMPRAHYVRCRTLVNEYDVTPRLGRVLPCCVTARQTQTWARVWQGMFDGSGVIEPECRARPGDDAAVYARAANEETYRAVCGLTVQSAGRPRIALPEQGRPDAGEEALVITVSPQAADAVRLGRTDGCSNQALGIDAENLSALRLALVREEGGVMRLQLWDRCEDLLEAGWDDCVFRLDEAERKIVFGDSLHGRRPDAGWDVYAVHMETSRFDGGNVLAGSAARLEDEAPGVTRVFNPAAAVGGCRRKTSAELQSELDNMMSASTRAVNEEDYRAIALATPGLMLDSVAVIPMKEYCATYPVPFSPNTVVVAVKPRGTSRTPRLSEAYRRAVAAQLEGRRLLATEVRVVGARYVGVSVYGRVRLRPGAENGRAQVEQAIRAMAETVNTGEYGRSVDYGRLFSALELVPAVQSVEQLSMEYVGRGGGKNEHGDITAGPDSLTYVREIGIEYI